MRRLSLRGIESDKPSVCMRRIKSQFLDAVEEKVKRVTPGKIKNRTLANDARVRHPAFMRGARVATPDEALVNDVATHMRMNEPLERVATVQNVSSASELLAIIQSPPFNDARWAFRGQGDAESLLRAGIERVASKPGIAEDYVEREFKRRAHHYLRDVPNDEDDLEWLALMQHHGAPTRLLDWTKSAYVAAFFAAEFAVPPKRIAAESERPPKPFAIWAIDERSVNAEAVAMLGLPQGDNNLSSRENFRRIYRDPAPEHLYLTAPVQPYRMNERLTIQQGLFLCANNPLMGFHRCLKRLLDYAQERHNVSGQWLRKLVVESEARLDVLSTLNKMNINRATLFPGLDGFSASLRINTEILDQDDWPEFQRP